MKTLNFSLIVIIFIIAIIAFFLVSQTTSMSNPNPVSTSCVSGNVLVNGKCVTQTTVNSTITPKVSMDSCNGDKLIPYSYALPCVRPTPICPTGMTYSNGVCTTTPPYFPQTPVPSQCNPNTGVCSSGIGYANVSCGDGFKGNICEPNPISCPAGLQGGANGTTCDYIPPHCSLGYDVIKISPGSYACQSNNSTLLSNPVSYSTGVKIGAFTISLINPYNVTGYYNSPYPIAHPGLGSFSIMHVGDILNPTCDGSAPLVITAIQLNSVIVSEGKPMITRGGCPICLSENSMIGTPNGEINVKDVKIGMNVWSTNSNDQIILSKVIQVNHMFVGNMHKVIDLRLVDGRELFVSPNHPTSDGRRIVDLKVRDAYDRSFVKSMELVHYDYQFTYDILSDSQTGNYFANGILMGSTLK